MFVVALVAVEVSVIYRFTSTEMDSLECVSEVSWVPPCAGESDEVISTRDSVCTGVKGNAVAAFDAGMVSTVGTAGGGCLTPFGATLVVSGGVTAPGNTD